MNDDCMGGRFESPLAASLNSDSLIAKRVVNMASGEENKASKGDAETQASVSDNRDINWPMVLYYVHIHLGALFGIYYVFTEAKLLTTVFTIFITSVAVLGGTAGAHRLWAHRTYTANTTLRILLMISHTLLLQGSIYNWVVDHRLHHKYFGTDIDPYNKKQGFFHAHLMTNLKKKHADYDKHAANIDTSDLEADPVVMFQKRWYWVLMPIVGILLPWNAPVEYWGEGILTALVLVMFLRLTVALHWALLINSGVHVWGIAPGDPPQVNSNLVFILTKSYWPQYHYLLPWDYQTGEYGNYGQGCTTAFIRIWAAMGWASGLKTMDSTSIRNALVTATETKRSVTEILREEDSYSKIYNESELYLKPNKSM